MPSSQEFFDSIGLASMQSVGQIPHSLKPPIILPGVLIDAEDTTNIFRLQFVDPEVKTSITSSYEEIQTLGRNIPVFGYMSTSGRKITLNMTLVASVSPVLEVDRKIKWLKTFSYQRDEKALIRPPKKIIVCMGMYLWLKGVVTDVSDTPLRPFGGLMTEVGGISMLPQLADVSVSISETECFWTGGQMTYEQAVKDYEYGTGATGALGQSSLLGKALNFL